jgi:hypothetical protein
MSLEAAIGFLSNTDRVWMQMGRPGKPIHRIHRQSSRSSTPELGNFAPFPQNSTRSHNPGRSGPGEEMWWSLNLEAARKTKFNLLAPMPFNA